MPFTLNELVAAYRDKLQREWQPTAWLLAMLHNVNCTDDAKAPADYDVYAPRKNAGYRMPFKAQVAAIAAQFRKS